MVEHGIAPIGVDLYTPDLSAIARGYGCFAERARDHAHLAELLGDARERGTPSLIEVIERRPSSSAERRASPWQARAARL